MYIYGQVFSDQGVYLLSHSKFNDSGMIMPLNWSDSVCGGFVDICNHQGSWDVLPKVQPLLMMMKRMS